MPIHPDSMPKVPYCMHLIKNAPVDESGFEPDDDDDDKTCVSCGAIATHFCGETGQFVCGYPLCDDCEHTVFEDGTNGGIGFDEQPVPEGMGRHCKKSEQRFSPWYKRINEQ